MSQMNSDVSRQFYKDGFNIYSIYDTSASSGMQLRREEIILQQTELIWSNVNVIADLQKISHLCLYGSKLISAARRNRATGKLMTKRLRSESVPCRQFSVRCAGVAASFSCITSLP